MNAREHCLPGCDRLDGHDGRDREACMRGGVVMLPETEISRAVRADADAARAEIRAEGIICPSCGVNMADLPWDHMLGLDHGGVDWERAEQRPASAKCAAGQLVPLDGASFETWQAAASVNLWDKFREAEDAAFSKMLGFDAREGPPRRAWPVRTRPQIQLTASAAAGYADWHERTEALFPRRA